MSSTDTYLYMPSFVACVCFLSARSLTIWRVVQNVVNTKIYADLAIAEGRALLRQHGQTYISTHAHPRDARTCRERVPAEDFENGFKD